MPSAALQEHLQPSISTTLSHLESHLSLASASALCSSVVSICSPLSTFTHPFPVFTPVPRIIPLHLVFCPLPSHALTVTSCLTHRGWHEGIEPSRHILIISLASRHYIPSPRPISAHHCLMRYPDEGTHEGIEFTVHHPPFLIFLDHFRTEAGILLPSLWYMAKAGILLPQHRWVPL